MIIIIVNSKKWFKVDRLKKNLIKHTIYEISNKKSLSLNYLKKISCDLIFFVHWNWIVPEKIIKAYKCILFHTAPLPIGRGGSPIQNLILKGYKSSPVWALEMVKELDAGPLLVKKNISLQGNLVDIFNRIEDAIIFLIYKILSKNIKPKNQKGEIKFFSRLNKKDNEISNLLSLNQFYDRIRMLDAPDYPNAYIKYGDKIIFFKNARFKKGKLTCEVEIKSKG